MLAALRLEYARSSWKKTATHIGPQGSCCPFKHLQTLHQDDRATGLNSLIYGSASIPDGTVQPQDFSTSSA